MSGRSWARKLCRGDGTRAASALRGQDEALAAGEHRQGVGAGDGAEGHAM